MRHAAVLLLALAGLTAPVGVIFATHALADSLGKNFGGLAASSLGFLHPTRADPIPGAPIPQPAPERAETEPASPEIGAAANGKRPNSSARSRPRTSSSLGIRVSARQVLDLARRRAIPQATPVAPTGTRPAGLRLTGVGGLGVGMRDGDILTRVAGVPVTSVGAVANLVISARARQAPEISAEFWRDGVRGTLVVEQPYLPPNASSSPLGATESTPPATPSKLARTSTARAAGSP